MHHNIYTKGGIAVPMYMYIILIIIGTTIHDVELPLVLIILLVARSKFILYFLYNLF